MKRLSLILLICLSTAWSCTGTPGTALLDVTVDDPADTGKELVADVTTDLYIQDVQDLAPQDLVTDMDLPDLAETDFGCAPGDGCFGDPCLDNEQCLSGFCVPHMGDGICTVHCIEECPPGFECQMYEGLGDVIFVCMSQFDNLCKPCVTAADCASLGAEDKVCVDYGPNGNFCGGACDDETACPDGYTCQEASSVAGATSNQCLPEAGECTCTAAAISLELATECEVENEFGTCSGSRICTEDGLSDCDALTPAAEICDGLDSDCDGNIDEPDLVDGDTVNLCNDDNPCTEDNCNGEDGCENIALDGTECQDGNPCTVADACNAGVCQGSPVTCDDDNLCTDDTCNETGGCDFVDNVAKCDDGDPCTVADECSESVCAGTPVACDCETDDDCESLEDDDICNGTLFCDNAALPYQCAVVPGTVIDCPMPDGPSAICQQPVCNPETGACSFAPDHEGLLCEDGDLCTIGDKCIEGVCTAGSSSNCNDGNPCTDDSCIAETGCEHLANTNACDDSDPCTTGDICTESECLPGVPTNCDDANVCTDDTCDPVAGCVSTPNTNLCNDGNACTQDDFCGEGTCLAGLSLDCDDLNVCTNDSCNPETGCIHTDNSAPCDDSNICTLGDQCLDSQCGSGELMNCEDGNVCTDDSCHAAKGCLHDNNQLDCTDLNICTTGDHCVDGLCMAGETVDCIDDNPCTTDWCDPNLECQHAPNSESCDDLNACTITDFCKAGSCISGGDLDCDDGDVCTTDSCAPEIGCEHINNTEPCDDSDACTTGDICNDGTCQKGLAVDCNDNNVCTDDSCHPGLGCQHGYNQESCDDGSLCTNNDMCVDGACVPGGQVDCDDGDMCTADSCNPKVGCEYKLVAPCCGNLIVEPPEKCDDGNHDNTDNCTSLCQFPSCDDQFANGDETDTDCGGPCPACPDGSGCLEDSDCTSFVCFESICQDPTCEDIVANGTETDTDCGGDVCDPCDDGLKCVEDSDCTSGYCQLDGTCKVPSCDDQVHNGDETDLDCGGSCPPCDDELMCALPEDCKSGVCTDGLCVEPKCDDEVKNGDETDVDCGGDSGCAACQPGQGCQIDSDCSGIALCQSEICNLYGSGVDGPLLAEAAEITINNILSTASGVEGEVTLTVEDAVDFPAGRRVLIHQTTGVSAGQWEERIVDSKEGTTLTLTGPLEHAYTSAGNEHAQAILVQEYTTVLVSGGSIVAPAWNGTKGGILALAASETMTVSSGSVNMNSRGFRGPSHACFYRCKPGHSGESPSNPMGTGTAPSKNGMGGGGGTQGQDCAAGGGGGYGTAGGAGNDGSSSGNCAANPHVGGQGGDGGGQEDLLEQILFGGAGGEGGGDEDGGNPGKGGNSGGLIIIKSPVVTVESNISAHGASGANGNQGSCGGWGCGMSGGGGGAGGAIYLNGETIIMGDGLIKSQGGAGGLCTCGNAYPGGSGGVGRIAVRAETISGTTTPTAVTFEP